MKDLARQEVLSIILTFFVGFLAGGYLYVNHFTQLVSPDSVESVGETKELTIVSRAYGGCRNNCPAFRVTNDGSYRYQYYPAVNAEPVFVNGTLPLNIQRELGRALSERALARQSVLVNPISCDSFIDGIDIEYDITYNGYEYTIDSCGTDVEFDSDLWLALAKIWNYFRTVE